ncbi:RNA methyltransferase [Jiella sp. M17.18]|uniref:RNA methyltransferase n=1 Tax=Jiella sp. M17.18 TaxID=3234247 RepID=UPI0034DDF7FC
MSNSDDSQKRGTGPAIVLVEPQLGENIGMVARAMANFGLTDLRLVNPRDGWPNEKARAAASRADHVIDAVRLFETVEAAIADLNFVLATTARPRDSFKPVRGPEEASADLRARAAAEQGTGILFGRERWGLNNEEVGLADEIVTFPVDPSFASLNIAQAVLLMSYAWQVAGAAGNTAPRFSAPEAPPATKDDLFRLFHHLEASLDRAGYFFPEAKREVLTQNLRTMLTKANFSEPEIHTLRGVIKAFDYEARRLGDARQETSEDEGA